jgi:hypothetical protein
LLNQPAWLPVSGRSWNTILRTGIAPFMKTAMKSRIAKIKARRINKELQKHRNPADNDAV